MLPLPFWNISAILDYPLQSGSIATRHGSDWFWLGLRYCLMFYILICLFNCMNWCCFRLRGLHFLCLHWSWPHNWHNGGLDLDWQASQNWKYFLVGSLPRNRVIHICILFTYFSCIFCSGFSLASSTSCLKIFLFSACFSVPPYSSRVQFDGLIPPTLLFILLFVCFCTFLTLKMYLRQIIFTQMIISYFMYSLDFLLSGYGRDFIATGQFILYAVLIFRF